MPFRFFLDLTISQTSLILYNLDNLEEYYQVFYKMFLNLDLYDDFPISLGLWIFFGGEGFFSCGSAGKESACKAGDLHSIPGLEDPLEKGKATNSSILA